MAKANGEKGFLLLELLLVLAIIGVLGGLLFVYLTPQLLKAQDAKTKEDMIQIRNSLTEYYDDYHCFPTSLPACGQTFKSGDEVYFNSFPCNSDGTPYQYQTDGSSCPTWYKLLTNLKMSNDPSIQASGCGNGCGTKCNYNYGISSSNIAINDGCPQTVQNKYACSPSGACVIYADPQMSQCPNVFINDPTCQNTCSNPKNRCHDNRGKQN